MWLRGGRGVCYSTDIDSDLGQYQIRAHAAGELADELEAAIRRGALRPGEELPSVRNMARELGISPTTVSAALAQLRARGLVATRERSKSFVAWRPPLESVWPLTSIPAGARDLASGNPDRELLPDLGAALRRVRPRQRLYGGDLAVADLLALARREFAEEGIDPAHLCVVSGALD